MFNIFDTWNKTKKEVDIKNYSKKIYPKVGEVWVCIIGKNIGFEQDGNTIDFSRPVLIIKKFNNQMYLVIPLSSKQKFFDFYYNFTDPNNNKVSAIWAQVKLVSVKRLKRKLYKIDNSNFCNIKNLLIKSIQ